jgi:hypothetical protein
MILVLILLWPYLVLAVMAWDKNRKGMNQHDRVGLVSAAGGLILMTTALLLFPWVFTRITGDRTANIGWGLLCLGSIVYCYLFLMGGFWIGKTISIRNEKKKTPNHERVSGRRSAP